jgi:hypothetical protein
MKRTELMMLVLGLLLFAQVAQADWTPAKRLTWNAGDSRNPAVAVDSTGGLHVVWQDETPGKGEVYYKRSTDGGVTWTANKRLTWDLRFASLPTIAVDPSGSLHLFWHTNDAAYSDIYYKKSTDGGNSWTGNKRLTWTQDNESPEIAVDSSGNLHLVWYSPLGMHLDTFYRKSTDGGSTWTPRKRITFTFSQPSSFPVIAADPSGNIHVVWNEDVWTGDWRVYYKKSSDGGATWSATKQLNWTAGVSMYPRIAIDSLGNVHVVYYYGPIEYEDTDYEIYYRKSTDAGDTWMPGKRLTWNSVASENPIIAVDSANNLHLVWEEGNYWSAELYDKISTDGGNTWSIGKNLTSTSQHASLHPRIAADSSGKLHLVWNEGAWSVDAEIYYMKYVK